MSHEIHTAILVGIGAGVPLVILLLEVWRSKTREKTAAAEQLVWAAAFEEQRRVESVHHTKFRVDQRVNAIQQRLARTIGKAAFSDETRQRVLAELRSRRM